MTLVVSVHEAGARLDRFLAELATSGRQPLIAGLSRARLQALLDDGHVLLDGRPAHRAHKLRGGEQLQLALPRAKPLALAAEPMPLDILYEDADLVAVAKPAGLSMHPGAGRTTGTLVNALLAHCRDLSGIGGVERPGIVHRLDRGTSGVVIVAKNDRAHLGLARQFAAREVEKRYVAFVVGTPKQRDATIESLYGRHPIIRQRFSGRVKTGKVAVTHYRTVASGGGMSRLDVLLGTGRTHQIRVHLSELGHPVVGDPTYGGRRLQRVEDPALRAACEALTHQALHAALLELAHPTTAARLRLEAPLPQDLAALAVLLSRG